MEQTGMLIEQGTLNFVGWCIVGSALVGALSAAACLVYLALQPGPDTPEAIAKLQDTYYVLHRPLWPLIICIVLSVVIGLIGFLYTDMFANRVILKDIRSSADEA